MNAKYALALIFALQVSTSLCDIPAPSQELVEKYDQLKATFLKRLMNAYSKLQGASTPMLESAQSSQHGQRAREFVEELQTQPQFQAFVKVASGFGQEASSLVDQARTSLLGLYEQYFRPHVGETLDGAINQGKTILDKYLPAE